MNLTRIRLRKPRRVLNFSCTDVPLQRDDVCIVHSDRGHEWGVCLLPPEPCSEEIGRKMSMRVLRKASQNDRRTYEMIVDDERRARAACLNLIQTREMPMKLVDVEYTFDKRKVVFFFTAEERVDFRELVRDLAHELRTRIELRHIQVRDEAKMVGGLGCCGRELCCASWLNEFAPISMRMAKRQNLSLNPTKISGQCGRLLCCLGYENDQYEDPKKRKRAAQQSAPCRQCDKGAPPRQDRDRPQAPADAKEDGKAANAAQAPPAEGSASSSPAPRQEGQPTSPERKPRKRGGRRRRKKKGGSS